MALRDVQRGAGPWRWFGAKGAIHHEPGATPQGSWRIQTKGALKARFTQASVNYIIERCIALSALVSVGIWIPGALPQADYEIAPFGAKQVRDGNAESV